MITNRILFINGVARSGKDTFLNFLREEWSKTLNAGVYSYSTIDMFKRIARDHFKWDGNKDEAGRKLLADLKFIYTRYNPDFIVNFVNEKLQYVYSNPNTILTICAREPLEIALAKAHFGDQMTTVLIDRPGTYIPNNEADQEVFDYTYDYIIDNSSTLEELKETVKTFVKEWNGNKN